jgi:hypothetical protein
LALQSDDSSSDRMEARCRLPGSSLPAGDDFDICSGINRRSHPNHGRSVSNCRIKARTTYPMWPQICSEIVTTCSIAAGRKDRRVPMGARFFACAFRIAPSYLCHACRLCVRYETYGRRLPC